MTGASVPGDASLYCRSFYSTTKLFRLATEAAVCKEVTQYLVPDQHGLKVELRTVPLALNASAKRERRYSMDKSVTPF